MTSPLILPTRTALELEARQRLGRGRSLAYGLASEAGHLILAAEADATVDAGFILDTRVGPLWLERPGELLSLLGDCPVVPENAEENAEWYWALISVTLATELAELFGDLRPGRALPEDGARLVLRLTAVRGPSRASTRLALTAATLLRLLAATPWSPLPAPALPAWPLRLPLVLAHLELSRRQLGQLAVGDLLRPADTLFQPDGSGVLDLGRWRVAVRLVRLHGLTELDILSIEESIMDPYATSDPLGQDDDRPLTLPEVEAEPFDDLPLPFTLRCGNLRLSLGALRDLAPGMLLSVPEATPGQASLCYGERPVAQGELVEVEGRLALQITRVDLAG